MAGTFDTNAGPKVDIVQQIDRLFEQWNRNDGPGLVVGVSLNDRVLYRRGVGMASLETGVANCPGTRMRIASISKHFTCALALLLEQERKLDLDAPIKTYLPELKGTNGEPTLRELMLHRGGSRCYMDVGLICHGLAPWPRGAAMKFQSRQVGSNFSPGTAMIYNNGGYYLLSMAIERVAGRAFEEELASRIFQPVGMDDTASIPSDYVTTPGIATMHVPLGDGKWRRGLMITEDIRGEGAIVSTIDDMLRWMQTLRSNNKVFALRWNSLTGLPKDTDQTHGYYALGVHVDVYRGVRTVSHSGGVIGGSSQMISVPGSELDIIVMSNGALDADPTTLSHDIIDIVLENNLQPKRPALASSNYSTFIGDWWSPDTGMVYNLKDEEGVLKLHAFGGEIGVELVATPDGELIRPESGFRDLTFSPDSSGAGFLTAVFGGRCARLQRLGAPNMLPGAAIKPLLGSYFSRDANASAVIALDGDALRLSLSDPIGSSESALTPVNENLLYAGPFAGIIACALTFHRTGDAVSSFSLNSVRTRNLRFDKVSDFPWAN